MTKLETLIFYWTLGKLETFSILITCIGTDILLNCSKLLADNRNVSYTYNMYRYEAIVWLTHILVTSRADISIQYTVNLSFAGPRGIKKNDDRSKCSVNRNWDKISLQLHIIQLVIWWNYKRAIESNLKNRGSLANRGFTAYTCIAISAKLHNKNNLFIERSLKLVVKLLDNLVKLVTYSYRSLNIQLPVT